MKHIIHLVEKYDDLAETLAGFAILLLTTVAIVGFAPLIMYLQVSAW